MKIFAIQSGEYSDYCVHGHCTSEDQARQACARLNPSRVESSYISDEFTYFEMDCLDSAQLVPILYLFTFYFTHSAKHAAWVGRPEEREPIVICSHCSKVVKLRESAYHVFITVRENNVDLAAKAAQDALYNQIALDVESMASTSGLLDPVAFELE